MFLGQYQLKFTGKGRLVLPKKVRNELGNDRLVLSRGFEGCIWGFAKKAFDEEAKRQMEVSVTEQRARNLRRYLFSSSEPVELDNQGRFVIPSTLLAYANLNDEVALIGAGDHLEIWDKVLWAKYLNRLEEEYGRSS